MWQHKLSIEFGCNNPFRANTVIRLTQKYTTDNELRSKHSMFWKNAVGVNDKQVILLGK